MSEKVVYEVINRVNGKRYVGSTNNKKKRWNTHRNKLKRGIHVNDHLQNAYNKYGSENFEFSVLERIDKQDELLNREQYYLDIINPEYNISQDAKAVFKGRHHTETAKKKISEALKGNKNSSDYIQHSQETRKKISEAKKGKKHTEETRRKLSEAAKGRELSKATKEKISRTKKGTGTGAKNSQVKSITEKIGSEVYNKYHNTSKTLREIAKEYSISYATVSRIKNGKHWSVT